MFQKFLILILILFSKQIFCLGDWAANSEMVKNAPCKGVIPSIEKMEKELVFESNKFPLENAQIKSLSLINQNASMIEHFFDLVTKRPYKFDPSEDVVNEKAIKLARNCKNILCSIKAIFGPRVGIQILWLKIKKNFNASHFAFDNASALKEADLNNIIQATIDYPNHLLPLGFESNRKLAHFVRGKTYALYEDNNVLANGEIFLFDGWDELQSNELKQYTVYHELAHAIGSAVELSENKNWERVSKCIDETKASCYVSKYAKTNVSEDLAESIAAYRYNPSMLKNVSLKKYNFIKKFVYRGMEYSSSQLCNGKENTIDYDITKKILADSKFDDSFKSAVDLMQGCENLIINLLEGKGINENHLKYCIKKNIVSRKVYEFLKNDLIVFSSIKFTNGLNNIVSLINKNDTDGNYDDEIRYDAKNLSVKLKNDLVDIIQEHDLRWRRLYLKDISKSENEFCDSWTKGEKHSYQIVSMLFDKYSDRTSYAFRHPTEIYVSLNKVCKSILDKRTTVFKDPIAENFKYTNSFSRSEITAAFNL